MTSILPHKAATVPRPDIGAAFREHAPLLLGYFIRRVTPAEDAADLVSETFLAAWKNPRRDTIAPDALKPWLIGIARHVLSQHRRGRSRRSSLADRLRSSVHTDLTAQRDGSASTPEAETAEHLRHLIGGLPTIDQEIVTLVYWEGFTQAEVALILKKPAATIRSRLSRARALLASLITESGEAAR